MTVWSEDSTRRNATSESPYTIFGVPLFIVSVTLVIPVMPLIAYLLGPGSIEELGMWLMGASGWVWIIGFVLLIVLEGVSHAREIVKHITAKS